MNVDTGTRSQSKMLQRLRWQRRSFWTQLQKNRGMAGGASDAVSASTQVKMIDAPRSLQLPEEARPEIWITIPPR